MDRRINRNTLHKIRELIKKKGGLTKISKEVGVKPQRLNNWIARKSYPTKFIKKLAKALNITVEELLDLIEKENPS